MTYDVAMRHQQALDPSSLITVFTTLHAIGAAIKDCRNAGKDAETDPAVILLVRHLSAVCEDRPSSLELRRTCMDQIAEIRRTPVLRNLAYRGVSYDEAAKRLFHSEGRSAMRRLADALGLCDGTYDIRSNKGGPAVSGEITLHGEEAWVQLSWVPAPEEQARTAADGGQRPTQTSRRAEVVAAPRSIVATAFPST